MLGYVVDLIASLSGRCLSRLDSARMGLRCDDDCDCCNERRDLSRISDLNLLGGMMLTSSFDLAVK